MLNIYVFVVNRLRACACAGMLASIMVTAVSAFAAIEYLPDENVIQITGFPPERPCTPTDLLRADRVFGWNKVSCCATSGVYILDCGFCVGRNAGVSTYFQIGSVAHTNETLVVRGNVRVYSTWLKGENTDLPYHKIQAFKQRNRLTLGAPDHPEIQARLLIDNQTRSGYSIIVGGTSGYGSENFGGELFAYHGSIAPFEDVRIGDGKPAAHVCFGGSKKLVLLGATIRGIAGAFGQLLCQGIVEHTHFENCGVGYSGNYQETLRSCTFDGCGIALVGPNRNPLVLYDCVFRDNTINWQMSHQSIIAIDCMIDAFNKGRYKPKQDIFFISKRHVVVKVTDEKGSPVEGAVVRAEPSAEPCMPSFDVCHAKTGPEGKTPGKGEAGALLLSELRVLAEKDTEGHPAESGYTYTITAGTDNAFGQKKNVSVNTSWDVLPVTLKAKER